MNGGHRAHDPGKGKRMVDARSLFRTAVIAANVEKNCDQTIDSDDLRKGGSYKLAITLRVMAAIAWSVALGK